MAITQLEAREVPATNLITNPSVEIANAAGTGPANFAQDNYGTNTATFSYPTTGLDGQRSVRVDMSAWTNGDAKWSFDTVPVTPGVKYTFSDLYTSDVETSATIAYKTQDGKWKYVGYYPTAASATPKQFTFDFTAPTGVVAATVFHLISAKGYLVTDAYSLTAAGTAPADTTAPTVAISAPTANATVVGTYTLKATAADNVAVTGLQFLVDGVKVGTEISGTAFQYKLNTKTLADGTHKVAAVAHDAAGNTTTSADVTFTVANNVVDTTAPTVSVTGPAANSTVSGSINLTASASDNVAVAGVKFFVDNVLVGSEDTSAPYQVSLDTKTLTNGSHTVTAVARDAAGNTTTSVGVAFTVSNTTADTTAPTVTVTGPGANATVSGSINLTATAADNVGVAGLQFLVDGNAFGSLVTAAPYQITLDTKTLTNGTHTVAATARDAAGNATTATTVTFTVSNPVPDTTPPQVSTTGPASNATVSGTINLTATASDNVGVVSVQFLVDGNAFGSPLTAAPYQLALNTTTLTNGTHTIAAIAKDAAGNSTTSVNVTVTVSNTTTTPVNLIQNPSLETLGTNGVPTGWSQDSWGTNTPAFSIIAGVDGANAARVQFTAYTSGDAKWTFSPVNVSASTQYTFSDMYRSNISSKLVAQVKLSDGTFSYVFLGTLAAASNWTAASFTLTTPANATQVTVFHLIEGVGQLDTDKYSLVATPTGSGGGGTTGKGMISLTFDDGWISQYQNAVPVLQQANLPATFYIISRANQGGASWEEVQNKSLETAGANNAPAGWSTYKTGTNDSAFSYATTGSDGTHSGKIDITSYSSGDAAWYFQPVHVTPGTQYTISHQYSSNAATSVLVRYTLHDGTYVWVSMGALASTGGQWKSQSFTLTAPSNADAVTILHRISSVGSLTVDNFSLKEVDPYSNPDYMTPTQIKSLQAAGFEVGAHTMDHLDLTTLSRDGVQAEIEGSKTDLEALGINVRTLAYPYGAYNTGIEQVVAADGYTAARTVNGGTNSSGADHYALMHEEVDRTTTVADVQGWIKQAQSTGTWLILTFHLIDNSSDFYGTTPQTFQQIVSLVQTSNLTPVTVADGISKL